MAKRKEINRRLMIRILYLSLILIISIFFSSCKKDNDFSCLENDYNYFNIKKTDKSLYGDQIYSMDIPYPGLHKAFIKFNYFIFKNGKIYEITLFENCMDAYIHQDYKINCTLKDIIESRNLYCNINLFPVIDFNLKLHDSLVYYKQHTIHLQQIKFNTKVNDTIYKFLRNWDTKSQSTIILATKKIGIIGVYDSLEYNGKIINPLGFTCNGLKDVEMIKASFDLDIIKEFK